MTTRTTTVVSMKMAVPPGRLSIAAAILLGSCSTVRAQEKDVAAAIMNRIIPTIAVASLAVLNRLANESCLYTSTPSTSPSATAIADTSVGVAIPERMPPIKTTGSIVGTMARPRERTTKPNAGLLARGIPVILARA